MEYDGGLPRELAEQLALAAIVQQMHSKLNGCLEQCE
jgi:hypothetical protein